jgi:hypothetical protein
MANKKKIKKKGFDPKKSELKRTLKHFVSLLKQEEIDEVMARSFKVARRHYAEDRQGHPSKWKFYGGKEWQSYGIKELLNIKAGRPVNDYRAGMLTYTNLKELAGHLGVEIAQSEVINRSVLWSQIIAKVKQDEDSQMNRLKKLWAWLEEGLEDRDIRYLMNHVPVYWYEEDCYLDPKWRLKHLSNIFEISNSILEVADAKMNSNKMYPAAFRLTANHLRAIAREVMKLDLPDRSIKEFMWQKILDKIDRDKMV